MMKLLIEAYHSVYNAFVSPERQKLRRALKVWSADGGCIMLNRIHDGRQ